MSFVGHFLQQRPALNYLRRSGPQSLRFAMGWSGLTGPAVQRVCELNVEPGITLLINAACNQNVAWVSNAPEGAPSPVVERLSRSLRLNNIRNFNYLVHTPGPLAATGEFDVITCRGVWGWLTAEAAGKLAAHLSASLSAAGIVHLDHPILPGQRGAAAVHRLLMALSVRATPSDRLAPADVRRAARDALECLDVDPNLAGIAWGERDLLESLLEHWPAANGTVPPIEAWSPRYFGETAGLLRAAGLDWACPTAAVDAVDALHLSPRQAELARTIASPVARQELRDAMTHARLREDIWWRTPQTVRDREETLGPIPVVLAIPAETFAFEAHGRRGRLALSRQVYGELVAILAAHGPLPIAELARRLAGRMSFAEVCDAMAILESTEAIQVVNSSADDVQRSMATARALNAEVLQCACQGLEMTHLGSPLSGGGVPVPWLHQLFLAGRADGGKCPRDWSLFAADAIGKLSRPAVGSADMCAAAEAFETAYLPIYKQLALTS